MKNIAFFYIFLVTGFSVYSQTWTLQHDNGYTEEQTFISKDQFDRIVRAQESISVAVSFNYFDASEVKNPRSRVIKGTRPNFNGYYYLSAWPVPNDGYERAIVIYGNSLTGRMVIIFYSSILPGTISLKYNKNEYVRQFNQLVKLVNGE